MSRRTLFIVLFVSLAVNLFVVGLGAGAFLFGDRLGDRFGGPFAGPFGQHRPPPFRGGGRGIMAAVHTLPADQQAAFMKAISDEAMVTGPKMREARELRRGAWQKLAADKVDPQAVTADLDRARALEGEGAAAVEHQFVDFAARLPATQRAALSQTLLNPPFPRGGRRGPGGPDGPPMPVPPVP